jgi:hypothetical protein
MCSDTPAPYAKVVGGTTAPACDSQMGPVVSPAHPVKEQERGAWVFV